MINLGVIALTMSKNKICVLKETILKLLIFHAILIIVLKIIFLEESIGNIVRVAMSLSYLFFLPGSLALLYLYKKFDFFERFVLGIILTIFLTGALSYYLSLLLNLHVKYHPYVLPPVIVFIGLFLFYKTKDHNTQK